MEHQQILKLLNEENGTLLKIKQVQIMRQETKLAIIQKF